MGLNDFSCYTATEYKSLLGNLGSTRSIRPKIQLTIIDEIPESIDWREKGVVNEIKNQGLCGSCWAFSTIQACESAYVISYGTLYTCSEQNLVDCCDGGCSGCSGGYHYRALDYVIDAQKGFLNSEDIYPYIEKEGDCKFDPNQGINKIKSYIHGIEGDEDYLKKLVAQGVCAIAIDGGWLDFQEYSGGIYNNPFCSDTYGLNHAVGVVGYGNENDIEYWIVRNSWGKSWGEDGYIRMIRNNENQCGIASSVILVSA